MLLDSAIGSLYDAAHGEKSWPDALKDFVDASGCHGTVLLSIDRPGNLYASTANLVETNQKYLAGKWYLLDQRYRATPLLATRGFASEPDFISGDEIKVSPFYQDFIFKSGLCGWAGLGFKLNGELLCLAIQRTKEQGQFALGELKHLATFTPHLARAVGLGEVIEQARTEGMLEITDTMRSAAFALDPRGHVLNYNKRAAALLGQGLMLKNDRLQARIATEDQRLQNVIWRTTHVASYTNDPIEPAAVTLNDGKKIIVKALPFADRHRYLFRKVAAILLATSPDDDLSSTALVLRHRFALTAQEAKFVTLLLDGRSVKECAESLAIRQSTARQYLKQILAKSGTHRQGELIALSNKIVREDRGQRQ
jgi:DNA-binding CsgD family transcriptional regulator